MVSADVKHHVYCWYRVGRLFLRVMAKDGPEILILQQVYSVLSLDGPVRAWQLGTAVSPFSPFYGDSPQINQPRLSA